MSLDYVYERPLEGTSAPGRLRPDFSFTDDAGDLVVWEHLGMLHRDDYRRSWEWKQTWYRENGYVEGKNLFTTREETGLDMADVSGIAEKVRQAVGG